jgi:hypothetical protein
MVPPLPCLLTRARTRRPVAQAALSSSTATDGHRQPEQPARTPGGLRCLWYGDHTADALASVDEFLRTPAATVALVEFCRSRRDSRAPQAHARALADAVGSMAAKVRNR